MTENELLHTLFSILFLVFLFERGYYQSKSMKATKRREYLEAKWFIIALIIIGQLWLIGVFLFLIDPQFLEWASIPLPLWVRWMGACLLVCGMVVEFSVQLTLGKYFSAHLHIREDHKLLTTGLYRHIRHPMYTALIITLTGTLLLSANFYVGLPLPATLLVIGFRLKREESAMIDKFGEEYIEYMKQTNRFFPRLFRK